MTTQHSVVGETFKIAVNVATLCDAGPRSALACK